MRSDVYSLLHILTPKLSIALQERTRNGGTLTGGSLLARPALRRAKLDAKEGIRSGCNHYFGARHRREHGNLHNREFSVVASAALCGIGKPDDRRAAFRGYKYGL